MRNLRISSLIHTRNRSADLAYGWTLSEIAPENLDAGALILPDLIKP